MGKRVATICLTFMAGLGSRCFAAETPATESKDAVISITLNNTSPGRVFEGIGAVSAGASTRLLLDYPEPQRSQILDFLFKPNFGAGFQHLKVEIGGGENSTCGSEPSHVLTKEELPTPHPRGYEFWFMAEARKRNPEIILDCLPWAYPQWVGNRFSQASADWFISFLEVARKNYGLEIDWISAAQNEMGTDFNWIRKQLRPTLDARGFSKVKLQAPDDDEAFWKIFEDFEKDPELDRLISAVGYHYVDGRNPWNIDQCQKRHATEKAKQSGKPLWASEEWSQSGREWGGKGALYLARLMNKLYSYDRITKYQIWCPIDSIYEQIIWGDTGAMQADTPWCGHYTVWPAIWAIGHTTQFAKSGWVYMDEACGQMSTNTWRGSHVALRDPKTKDWSVVVVTGEKQTVRLKIEQGLKIGPVYVWKSTATEQFVKLTTLEPRNQCVQLELDADAIYTLTSTTGQQKGTFGTPPPRLPFPLPFNEGFESYKSGDTARYFSDQKGTFEVAKQPDGRLCLAQVVPEQGIVWMGIKLLKPHTLFGDADWKDCSIQADVCLAGGDVELGGRYADRDKLGYRLILARDGTWSLNWQLTTLAKGTLPGFDGTAWHKLRLEMKGDQLSGWVDGVKLATVTDGSGSKGMAVLASSYDRNLFDNVCVSPLATVK